MPALLRGARDTYRREIKRSLLAGGFTDLPRNGAFVLGGMANLGVPLYRLVRQLGVTKQAASQLIDTLVERGYLERVTDPSDRRRISVRPTERGKQAARRVRAGVVSIDTELEKRLPQADLEKLRTGLITLVDLGYERLRDERSRSRVSK